MKPEIGNVKARYRRNVEPRLWPQELEKIAHHLLMPLRGFICPRFLLPFYEMIEPLRHTEHAQASTAHALEYLTQKLAGPRLGQPLLPRLSGRLLQAVRHFQRLALRR